jgi:hypothetical protein
MRMKMKNRTKGKIMLAIPLFMGSSSYLWYGQSDIFMYSSTILVAWYIAEAFIYTISGD